MPCRMRIDAITAREFKKIPFVQSGIGKAAAANAAAFLVIDKVCFPSKECTLTRSRVGCTLKQNKSEVCDASFFLLIQQAYETKGNAFFGMQKQESDALNLFRFGR